MDFFGVLLVGIGPLMGVASVAADARSGGKPLTERRVVAAAGIASAILTAPVGCVIAVGRHSVSPLNFPLALAAGAVYGTAVGGLLVGAMSWRRPP